MTTMTYGVMPTWEDFEAAFDRECPRGIYSIRLNVSDSRTVDSFKLGDGDYNAWRLYNDCKEIVDSDTYDGAMEIVAVIMYTLGFEWI